MLKAFGAWIRGESPQQFLQDLAKTRPELQGLDLTGDLNKTAEGLYRDKGEDIASARASIKNQASQFLANNKQ